MSKSILVLIVDDDVLVREIVETSLVDAGYEISTSDSGDDALAKIEDSHDGLSALVTDINLGKPPNGWEIARRVRELQPTLPVVYMTGAEGHDWPAQGVPNSVLLTKPFASAQIVTAVSSLINDADTQQASQPPPTNN